MLGEKERKIAIERREQAKRKWVAERMGKSERKWMAENKMCDRKKKKCDREKTIYDREKIENKEGEGLKEWAIEKKASSIEES